MQQWTYECSRPALALASDAPTDLRLDISCADPEVVGPSVWASSSADDLRIWRDITVDLQSPNQRIVIDVPKSGDPGAVEFLLKRCHTDCFDVTVNSLHLQSDGEEHQWLGPTGRYVVRVSRAADDPGPVHVRFEP
ncbi:hypothetical protein SAMN02745121_03051 [Nannocystis exedens]|uniref:F5/8 type C domain-containing protein n=1 Tax=Nannocystis exedens TaxID=54 RepID=A0A1I1XWW2_9BACT|nr:hypothetical protein [Nannocystis exedens]PCC73222.1 hypothetical protein NAEX_06310 [Nannocystis exedens]SFE10363.1 hypothetical protein SAMN02745121_03051 [Nannocystis exedens]